MAKNMVLTYLHLLDSGDLPLISVKLQKNRDVLRRAASRSQGIGIGRNVQRPCHSKLLLSLPIERSPGDGGG